MPDRKKIREALLLYFQSEDFSVGAFTSNDKGSIEALIKHIVKAFSLSSQYRLKKGEKATGKGSSEARKRLRNVVGQEVALMKRKGLIRRVTWGRYRPLG
tara:strand:- start:1000 stop:1299 length:300 start_codon:yes stop_codon:yes gene_type:complete